MKKLFYFACCAFALTACSDDDYSSPQRFDKYQGGFYVVNEGQYGKSPASVNYYGSQGWERDILLTNDASATTGMTGTVGVCSDKMMYVVTKTTPFVTEINLESFTQNSTLDAELGTNGQARSLALLGKNQAVLTASTGAYLLSLNPLMLGDKFTADDVKPSGDVAVAEGSVFVMTSSAVKVYNASTLAFVKDLPAAKTGFAQAGGYLWAANGSTLVKIDPSALTAEQIALGEGVSVYMNPWAYSPTGLHASKQGDRLFFVNQTTAGYSTYGRDIYCYTIATGTAAKFFEAPVVGSATYSTYGAGLAVNPSTGNLYLTYTEDGWGEHYLSTSIYVVDAATGIQRERIAYTSDAETIYWFPSMILFR